MTYVVDVMGSFPKRWRDRIGPLRVMCEPSDGYVMVRRPHCMPFVMHVRQILGSEPYANGPVVLDGRKSRRRADASGDVTDVKGREQK